MASLVVSEFITVDGAIEDPGGAEGSAHGGRRRGLGSSQLGQGLIEHDLIDEYGLMVYPGPPGQRQAAVAGADTTSDLHVVDAVKAGDTVIFTFRPASTATA
jgi:hypothetical protein